MATAESPGDSTSFLTVTSEEGNTAPQNSVSLKFKTVILLGVILLVMSIIISATFWVNNLQKNSLLLINIAGRQRMLSQKMTKEILGFAREKEGAGTGLDYRKSLVSTIETFDKTLNILIHGGSFFSPNGEPVTLQKTSDPAVLEKLQRGSQLWKELNKNIEIIIKSGTVAGSEESKKAMAYIESSNSNLLAAMNDVTEAYQHEADRSLVLLEKIQIWALVITLAVMISAFYLIDKVIIKPLSIISENLLSVANGDVTAEIKIKNRDELGNIAAAVNTMAASLRVMIAEIAATVTKVSSASESISSTTEELTNGVEIQSTSIEKTSASIEEMNASMKDIAENTVQLSQTSDKAAQSTLNVAAYMGELARIAESLSGSIDEVSSSIIEMASSVKEISKHTSQVSNFAEDTATAVAQINSNIKEVEGNLKVSAQLAETTTNDAEAGREAVRKTIDGMDKIKDTVNKSTVVIKQLGARSEAIGEILNVINEVAEQTNLLALNAAIIAAQAGEHGKGFAVVADEIKDLAERTTSSTREIEQLIRAVQNEAANAVKSMEVGGKTVEAGVVLSQKAGEALEKILAGANSSKEMVKLIARATQEQLKGSQQAKEAMEKITEMVRKVYLAIEDQEKGSANIATAAEKMKEGATLVKENIGEQNESTNLIRTANENIAATVNAISRSTQEQTRGNQEVMKAMLEIKGIIGKNVDGLIRLSEVTEIMSTHTSVLGNAVNNFKV